MINVVAGRAVEKLLSSIALNLMNYDRVVICSPFMDQYNMKLVATIVEKAAQTRCRLSIITRPLVAIQLEEHISSDAISGRRLSIFTSKNLHAKAYLAASTRRNRTKAIITSANLTTAGLTRSQELGILATSTSEIGNELIRKISRNLDELANSSKLCSAII
jgi:HKD family nuclease